MTLDDEGRIVDIIEKPVKPRAGMRGTGVYLFHPLIFDFIDKTPASSKRNEKEITDAIRLVAKAGKAYGAPIKGTNININTFSDLLKATRLLLSVQKQ